MSDTTTLFLVNALKSALSGTSKDYRIFPTQSRVTQIKITKNSTEFDLVPWSELNVRVSNEIPFNSIIFKESIFDMVMSGFIVIFDLRNWVDEFKFNGEEYLTLKMFIGNSEEEVEFKFYIANAINITDEASPSSYFTNNERMSLWRLDLVSSQIFLPNYYSTLLDSKNDYVGILSKEQEKNEEISTDEDPGLINAIFNYYKLPVNKIEASNTGIWLKHNHISYPWMKRKGQINLVQLLNYLSRYAWSGTGSLGDFNISLFNNPLIQYTGKLYADYSVWEDRNGWNFRSLSSIAEENETPVDAFYITTDETNPNRIVKYNVIRQYDKNDLLENGGLFAFYKRIDPNFDNPYIDFTDSAESMKERNATYDYHRDYERGILIENYKLVPEDFDTSPFNDFEKPKEILKNDDNIYGFFYNNFLNTPTAQNWEKFGHYASTPWSDIAWQPQFDLTDLPFSIFQKIHKEIRIPLKAKREELARKKNIKRKWEVYRCTICCHEDGPIGSKEDLALLSNPGPIDGFTYQALFGATGIYGTIQEDEYKIVAAGSFTDTLNYDRGNTANQYGLTYSYDLTKAPYNESIGQFFNIVGPQSPSAYRKYVIERATNLYSTVINKIDERILQIDQFLSRVDSYKSIADDIFKKSLIKKNSNISRPIDLTQGFRFVGDSFPGSDIGPFVGDKKEEWPITNLDYGLVPYTSIPAGKGVGVVVFGEDPNANTQITFRFSSGDESSGSGDGPAVTQRCISCSGCSENTTTQGSDSYYQFFESCSDVNGYSDSFSLQGCNQLPSYYLESVQCDLGCDVDWGTLTTCDYGNCRPFTCFDKENVFASVYEDANACATNSSNDGCGSNRSCTEGNCLCCSGAPDYSITNSIDPEGDGVYACPDGYSFVLSESDCAPEEDDNTSTGETRPCICGGVSFNIPIEQECPNCEDATVIVVVGERGPTGPTGPTGPSGLPTDEDIVYISPGALTPCSTDPIIRGYIKYIDQATIEVGTPIYDYAAPYLWDNGVKDWSFFDYSTDKGLVPAISDPILIDETRKCLRAGNCYNTTCLSSNALESLRRTVVVEKELLNVERTLIFELGNKVNQTYTGQWNNSYNEWYQRNSFFFAKQPGSSIFRNQTTGFTGISSPLSLQNIKKITRKEIRGSRYELLSRYVGITGASAGQWLYEIYFGGNQGSTAHPYYDQSYNSTGYVTSRSPHFWFNVSDADATDDPRFYDNVGFNYENIPVNPEDPFSETSRGIGPEYRALEFIESAALHVDNFSGNFGQTNYGRNYGPAQSDLTTGYGNLSDFKNTYNFYNVVGKKPPNIKKEEISSYVRIEFFNPIGLETIKDFPNGFIRDAGVEYFLPYLVNITPGPFGRHGVKYNIAVIGMDPFGFDVAVKRIKDDIPTNRKLQGIEKGNYYNWWNHDTGSVLSKTEYLTTDYNGMDLWPEPGFETDYPYYAYDASQEDLHGGGYDLDFHMGGGYFFENDSQDWMESLYHYGVSSGKQFDPLYRTSVVGSYILPNSYRKLKPHRSWWSLFIPRNLFIPIRFANMLQSPNTKARDMFGGNAIFTINPNYWRTWYGSEFETWLSLEANSTTNNLLSSTDIGGGRSLNFFVEGKQGDSISPYTTNLQGYFHESLMNYLAGNYNLYRPGLVATDLWKYDLSGETEYGLVTPPVDTEYEFFDRNFAAQFVVFAKSRAKSCKDLGLDCVNPSRPIITSDNCEIDPYCNCPAQNVKPTEKEPTYLEIFTLEREISECSLIQEVLGEEYLGCEYSNPNSTCSCNCPEWGPKFKNYLAYTRTYATFWETPIELPIYRQAQMAQWSSQILQVAIAPSEKIKIGNTVEIINENDLPNLTKNEYKSISGKWMVTGINHELTTKTMYYMVLTLIRNSNFSDPNQYSYPTSLIEE